MRWDMFKVIVERPRMKGREHPRGRDAERVRLDPEHAPLRESTARGRQANGKHLNENLAPLRRFVLGQVGRPWDKVHAEICEHLRLGSAIQRHVLEHLDDFVVREVEVVDGRPVHRRHGWPVVASRWRHMTWVCPRSGILRRSPPRERSMAPAVRDRVELADGDQLQRLDGVWYHLSLMPLSTLQGERKFDAVLHLRLDGSDYWALRQKLKAQYGRDGVYAEKKIQLGKRALARLLPEGMR